MLTLARRLFWLAVLGGVGYALYTAWQRRNEPVPNGPAEWPPFDDGPAPTPSDTGVADVTTAAVAADGAPLPDLGTSATASAPLPDLGDRPATVEPADASAEASADTTWVSPTDGVCPIDFPIKGKASSGIYHVPGGRFYDRTAPDRCYATEDGAVADGYRRAKA